MFNSDQLPVSTKFDMRSDPGVARNYGKLLVEMVSVVPDGIVCFFVSYSYMDGIINSWNETGVLKVKKELTNIRKGRWLTCNTGSGICGILSSKGSIMMENPRLYVPTSVAKSHIVWICKNSSVSVISSVSISECRRS